MKQLFLSILLMLLPVVAWADAVEIDGIWYNLISKGNFAEVAQSPNNSYSGAVTIPASIEYEGTTYSVTVIGNNAFLYCYSLTSVTIPESVTSIGGSAFNGCSSLTSVTIPESVTSIGGSAFNGCSGLTSVTIPEGVTSIGNYAFQDCSGLISVTIPEGVTSIGYNVFNGCSGLTSVTIPEGVTSIGHGAFSGCSGLTSVTIPEGLTSIGDYAFYGCTGLTSMTIPEGVTSIGGYAFFGCSSLTSVLIPNGVTSVGSSAFQGCSAMKSVTISENVCFINDKAIANCTELENVYCYSNKIIGDYIINGYNDGTHTSSDAFDGSYIDYATLHVPAQAVESCRTSAPWSGFGQIVGDIPCLTINSNGVGGKVTYNNQEISNGTQVYVMESGSNATLTITPNSINEITSLTVNGEDAMGQLNEGVLTLTNISGSIEVNVTFAKTGQMANLFLHEDYGFDPDNGTLVAAGHIWGEAGDALTLSNPFDDTFKPQSQRSTLMIGDNEVQLTDAVQGFNNPKDEDMGTPSLTLKAPASGAALQIDAKKNGWAYVFFRAGSNKAYTVFEDGKAVGYTFAALGDASTDLGEVYQYTLRGGGANNRLEDAGITAVEFAEQEFLKAANPEAYNARFDQYGRYTQISRDGLGVIKFAVNRNSTYIVNANGSKIMWGAVYFSENENEEIKVLKDETYITLLNPVNDGIYHQMTVNASGNGSVVYINTNVKAGTRSYYVSGSVTIALMPDNEYLLEYVKVNGVDKTAEVNNGQLTIADISADLTVDVRFTYDGNTSALTIGSTGMATYCSTDALDFSSVTDIRAYVASGFNPANGKLLLMHVSEVPAGTGLIIKGTPGTYSIPVKPTMFYYLNLLTPVFEAANVPAQSGDFTNYVLANGEDGLLFYRSNNASLAANRAYLQLPTAAAGARQYVDWEIGEEATAISNVRSSYEQAIYYNLNGQRVEHPQKGIYIKNGKKILIK